jgi:hypothetical protein
MLLLTYKQHFVDNLYVRKFIIHEPNFIYPDKSINTKPYNCAFCNFPNYAQRKEHEEGDHQLYTNVTEQHKDVIRLLDLIVKFFFKGEGEAVQALGAPGCQGS